MSYQYVGAELELFAGATNWKRYMAERIRPFVGRRVLEVGAGLGSNIPHLHHHSVEQWTALEPDAALASRIAERIRCGDLPGSCQVIVGTIEQIAPEARFDTILYVDVLEHIADDAGELARAAPHLRHGGKLVVLAPAHQWLFSPFDAAVGHYRRYDKAALARITPDGCRIAAQWMLDSVGFFASLANRIMLRKAQPSREQIAFWDSALVPPSRFADRITGFNFGKTVVTVWDRIG